MPDVSLTSAVVLLTMVIVGSFVTHRVTRFLILDGLLEEPRQSLHNWLAKHPGRFTIKAQELMICPWCISIWVSGGWVLLTMAFTSVPLPVWVWLAGSTGCLVFWRILDAED